jgi:hypothetical protein
MAIDALGPGDDMHQQDLEPFLLMRPPRARSVGVVIGMLVLGAMSCCALVVALVALPQSERGFALAFSMLGMLFGAIGAIVGEGKFDSFEQRPDKPPASFLRVRVPLR